MTEDLSAHIRPGAAVECADGPLGVVEAVPPGPGGGARLLVAAEGERGRLAVPLGLVREVAPDGTVLLGCARAEAGQAVVPAAGRRAAGAVADRLDSAESERTVELREEQLVPRTVRREVGEVVIRTVAEEVPGRLEVEALRDEVEVIHEPAGEEVDERVEPYEEGDALVVPVYEEQLVVVKRLVLKERLRIRRRRTAETRLIEQPVRRERLVIEDPQNTGRVRELSATVAETTERTGEGDAEEKPNLIERVGRKAFE